jgi:predicted DNA-binding protein (UPF0278 family)
MKDKNPFFLAIKLKEFDLKIAKTRLALYKYCLSIDFRKETAIRIAEGSFYHQSAKYVSMDEEKIILKHLESINNTLEEQYQFRVNY